MAEFLPPHQAPISFEDFHNYTSQPLDDYNQFQSSQTIAPSHTATGLDFFSLEDPNALLAPHLDQFESELDNLTELDDPQLQLVALDQSEPYSFLRSDTPSAQQYRQPGPGSAFSESLSGYESISGYSESIYRPQSEYITSHRQLPTDYIVPDYIMDLTRIRLDAPVAYPAQKPSPPSMSTPRSSYSPRNSYGGMPPSPPQQQQQQQLMDQHYRQRSDSSGHEYGRPMRGSQSEYGGYAMRHPSLLVGMQPGRQGYVGRNGSPPSVSPSSTTSSTDASGLSIPLTPPVPLVPSLRGEPQVHAELVDDDPRRKYKCPNCPRSFARAFNLKTHMATHDPNRPKPHVCPHRACSRSFSRKHDLGRHLVSIHRDEHGMVHASQGIAAGSPAPSVSGSARSERGVGVDKGPRGWCDTCGQGWVGSRERGCNCHDVS